jgi:energy-coupling factor transporter ATP-binding protein EcfA2
MPYNEILKFSKGRNVWQQDSLRRIVTQTDLTDQDLKDIIAILKAQYGLIQQKDAPKAVPLNKDHFPQHSYKTPPTILNSLGDVKGINNLSENQTLKFAVKGLTIVYGDNGSGKSGYCRVAKKICRVREGADEKILGNAFKPQSGENPPEATARFNIEGDDIISFRWKEGKTPPGQLSRISVFDAKTVPIYADKSNRVEFLPRGLDVLPKLGDLCKKISEKISKTISVVEGKIQTPLPKIPKKCEAESVLNKLLSTTAIDNLPTEAELKEIGEWNESFSKDLETVQKELNSDPEVQLVAYNRFQKAISQLIEEIDVAESKMSDATIEDIKKKIGDAKDAQHAVKLTANETFPDAPLGHIGSKPWRQMFQFAKEYSELVYPGQKFPVTGSDKVCPLCQQSLIGKPAERIEKFSDYIKNKAQKNADEKEKELKEVVDRLKNLNIRFHKEIKTLLLGIDSEDEDIIENLEEYFKFLSNRKTKILEAIKDSKSFEKLPAFPTSPLNSLKNEKNNLKKFMEEIEKAKNPEKKKETENKRDNLLGREILSAEGVIDSLIERRSNLILLAIMKSCKNSCSTDMISRKNTELRRNFFTEEYQRRIEDEIQNLGLAHIPLKIKDYSRDGSSYLGVELDTVSQVRAKEILSDGEFNSFGLACFFAEIDGIPGNNGIIVDDPVSSLDHLRIRKVAERLATEAQKRQVIVFTHDMVFFHELQEAAAIKNTPTISHWMRPTSIGCGTIGEGEEPWQAKKVNQRIHSLKESLAKIKKIDDRSGEKYRKLTKDFYTDLRETWERLVEEQLLNGVIGRFQSGVKTQSLKGVCVVDDDYKKIFFAMARASEYSGHDKAEGKQSSPPDIDAMNQDIEEIENYTKELNKRIQNLQKQRKALEKAPTAVTA